MLLLRVIAVRRSDSRRDLGLSLGTQQLHALVFVTRLLFKFHEGDLLCASLCIIPLSLRAYITHPLQILRGRSRRSRINRIHRLLSPPVFSPAHPPSPFTLPTEIRLHVTACTPITLSCRHARQIDNDTESRLWLIPLLCLLLAVPLHPSIGSRMINITWAFSTCVS